MMAYSDPLSIDITSQYIINETQLLVNMNLVFFLFCFCFYLGFTARQDYFTHFEPRQSNGRAKMGDPQEKPPDHPQAELGLSQVTLARLEPTALR